VRPSEKTAPHVISGFAPVRPPRLRLAIPRRGGLRTPARETLPPPGNRPIRPPGVHLPPMIMLCLGLRLASECGRTECVPPRKPPSALCQGFRRKTIPAWIASPRRGGLRMPAMRELASPEHVPSRPPGVHLPPVIMICLGLRMAFPRGRTECVPPRRRPSASSPGLHPVGKPRWGGPPRGGAGSARPEGRRGLDRGMSPLGHRVFRCSQ